MMDASVSHGEPCSPKVPLLVPRQGQMNATPPAKSFSTGISSRDELLEGVRWGESLVFHGGYWSEFVPFVQRLGCCRTRGDHRIPVEAELVFVEAQRILFLIDDENRAHWVCISKSIST